MRHLIDLIRPHELTKKKTMKQKNTNMKTMTKTNTFREHLQRAIPETVTFEKFDRGDEER